MTKAHQIIKILLLSHYSNLLKIPFKNHKISWNPPLKINKINLTNCLNLVQEIKKKLRIYEIPVNLSPLNSSYTLFPSVYTNFFQNCSKEKLINFANKFFPKFSKIL